MNGPVYLYGSVGVIRHMFDYDRIPVMFEDSYIWHEYLHLTYSPNAWNLGELRVEFVSEFEQEVDIRWVAGSGYVDREISEVVRRVKDVVYRHDGLTVELAGRMFMTDVTRRFGEMYKLGEILLQEQLVVKQADSWERYMQFCEKNSGFIFPGGMVLVLSEEGVRLSQYGKG